LESPNILSNNSAGETGAGNTDEVEIKKLSRDEVAAIISPVPTVALNGGDSDKPTGDLVADKLVELEAADSEKTIGDTDQKSSQLFLQGTPGNKKDSSRIRMDFSDTSDHEKKEACNVEEGSPSIKADTLDTADRMPSVGETWAEGRDFLDFQADLSTSQPSTREGIALKETEKQGGAENNEESTLVLMGNRKPKRVGKTVLWGIVLTISLGVMADWSVILFRNNRLPQSFDA